jgi:hypothetical protein
MEKEVGLSCVFVCVCVCVWGGGGGRGRFFMELGTVIMQVKAPPPLPCYSVYSSAAVIEKTWHRNDTPKEGGDDVISV